MSSNHTRLDRQTYEANMKELIRLEECNGSERAARNEIARMANQMIQNNRSLAEQASASRRNILNQLEKIEKDSRNSFVQHEGRIQKDAARIQSLMQQTKALGADINRIIEETRKTQLSAATIMSQVKFDLQISTSNPDYQKFGKDKIDELAAQLKAVDCMEQSDVSLQQVALRMIGNIYALDAMVSTRKQQYELEQLEAQGLAAQIKNKMHSARNNVRYGDEATELVDLDYWTDNKFKLLEDEVDQIKSEIEAKRYDPDFGIEELRSALKRLNEIDKIQLHLVQDAIEKSNLSETREEMAQVITQLLSEQYGYTRVIGCGFDLNDPRECYIVRLQRHTDGAQIEVLINPGTNNGDNEIYFRIDTATYCDQKVMDGINNDIERELREYGIHVISKEGCHPETLEEFNPAQPRVSAQVRARHNIQTRNA